MMPAKFYFYTLQEEDLEGKGQQKSPIFDTSLSHTDDDAMRSIAAIAGEDLE